MDEVKTRLRYNLAWGSIAFGVTLALVVGLRLDRAALTAVVGVACGVGASIPAGLMLLMMLNRRARKQVRPRPQHFSQTPQVVVIQPPNVPQMSRQTDWSGQYAFPAQAERQFSMIGEEFSDD